MNKVVIKNIGINFTGLILPTFVSLATVPAYIRLLGDERYGVVNLVWTLIGYFSVLDLGMSLATEQKIAKARVDPSADIADIFWSAWWLNLATGLFGGIVIWGGGSYYVAHILHTSIAFQQEVLGALPWIAVAIPIANVAWVFAGALNAYERFRAFAVNQTLGTLLFQLFPLFCVSLSSATLAVVIPAAVIARLIATVVLGVVTIHALGIRRIRPPTLATARNLLSFGRWAVIQSTASAAIESLDRVLIGSMLGARFVAFYTVPQNVVTRLNLLPGAMLRALFPRLSQLNGGEARHITLQALAFLNALFTPCVVVALFYLKPFLAIWINPIFAEQSAIAGQILIIAVWLSGQSSIVRILMFAQAGGAIAARLSIVILPPFFVALWLAIQHGGITGAALTVVGRTILEYGILVQVSRLPRRSVLTDMSVQLCISVVGLFTAQTLSSSPERLMAALALIVLSASWSYCTSAPLRAQLHRVWQRGFKDRLSLHADEKPPREPSP